MEGVPLPEQFREFSESCGRDGAVTYAAICRGVAGDERILGLMDEAPASQRRPNLLLAAVHFLLLGGADHPLRTHYDTVAAYTGSGGVGGAVGDVVAQFEDFCVTYREALLELVSTGSTQTNEVGRCTALLPALNHISSLYGGREALGLLDLGTSAGLNLLFDRYAYVYRPRTGGGPDVVRAGAAGSAVVLECSVRGEMRDLPTLGPDPVEVAGRSGLDLAPVDPHDEAGARWLLACLWPDHPHRFERLRDALEIARQLSDPPVLHAGDMVDQLAEVAATVAPGRPLVVFHSWVAAYLTPTRQRELVQAVRALPDGRPVHYLYAESPVETPGLPTPPSPEPGPTSDVATVLVHVPPGGEPVRLADMHHHGRSLRWWPQPEAGAGLR